MARRFEEMFDILEYDELLRMKSDVDSGSVGVKKLIEEKIKRKLREHDKSCSACSGDLKFYSTSNYTLVFGPDDFKKKASFCGIDCLEYFIIHLKNRKSQKEEKKEL